MPILRDEFDYPQEEDKQNKKHNYTFNPLRLPHPFTNLQLLLNDSTVLIALRHPP